jgi:hypothetical protein
MNSYGDGFCFSCLDQKLVYSWNHPLRRTFAGSEQFRDYPCLFFEYSHISFHRNECVASPNKSRLCKLLHCVFKTHCQRLLKYVSPNTHISLRHEAIAVAVASFLFMDINRINISHWCFHDILFKASWISLLFFRAYHAESVPMIFTACGCMNAIL